MIVTSHVIENVTMRDSGKTTLKYMFYFHFLICFYIWHSCKPFFGRHTLTTITLSIFRFECPLCHKEFKSKQRLQEHERVEHEGHRYLCEQCPKMFRNKHKLKEHVISVHTTLKPHRCQHCNSSFARRSALTYHLQKVHDLAPNEPIPPEPIKSGNTVSGGSEGQENHIDQPGGGLPQDDVNTEPVYVVSTEGLQTLQQGGDLATDKGDKPNHNEGAIGNQTTTTTTTPAAAMYTEPLIVPQIQGMLPNQVTHLTIPQTLSSLPQTLGSQSQAHLTLPHQPLAITDINQQTVATMATFDPNQANALQPQQQAAADQQQQQQPIFLPQHILQHFQPATIGQIEPSPHVQLSNLAPPQAAQSYVSQGTMPNSSLSNVDINNAITQTLAQFAQAQYVLPTEQHAFYNTGPQNPVQVNVQQTLNVDVTQKE